MSNFIVTYEELKLVLKILKPSILNQPFLNWKLPFNTPKISTPPTCTIVKILNLPTKIGGSCYVK